jgi:hypothetical protein
VLTDDFRFQFATGDTAGNKYRVTPWSRDDELLCAVHLFRDGSPLEPPSTTITLDYTQDPTEQADPRPGMDAKWHRLITVEANLRVFLSDGGFEVRGPAYFFVVRGDSAQIPADLIAEGAKPDSTRWWLDLWVDGTLSSGVQGSSTTNSIPRSRILPNHGTTWGSVKVLYR